VFKDFGHFIAGQQRIVNVRKLCPGQPDPFMADMNRYGLLLPVKTRASHPLSSIQT
jgi:hypothetical protein